MLFLRSILLGALLFILPAASTAEVDKAEIPSRRLIVFVHGIGGDAQGTFSNADTKVFWPELLRSDGDVFSRADIYSYGYKSGLGAGSSGIDLLASEMALRLEQELDIRSYQSVLFIAHSLGGIIVRKYLLDQHKLQDHGVLSDNRVKGIYLFGTPMNGSGVANIGMKFFNSKTLWQLGDAAADPDQYLSRLSIDWINEGVGDIVSSRCAFETRGVVKFFLWERDVVNWSSASALCNSGIAGIIDADHFELVKPASAEAQAHLLVREWYNSIFQDQPLQTTQVVLVNCEVDPYVETFTPLLSRTLSKESITYSASVRLPQDWAEEDVNYLWNDAPPKVVIVHFGCFADGLNDAGQQEAADDFNRFLSSVEKAGLSVVMYSRAYDDNLFEEQLTKENQQRLVETGRICPVALKHRAQDRTKEAKRVVNITINLLSGKKCE
jgi:pimeloyl-ACP methyl ester carboxylesterase